MLPNEPESINNACWPFANSGLTCDVDDVDDRLILESVLSLADPIAVVALGICVLESAACDTPPVMAAWGTSVLEVAALKALAVVSATGSPVYCVVALKVSVPKLVLGIVVLEDAAFSICAANDASNCSYVSKLSAVVHSLTSSSLWGNVG